ncbi:hypothetical protein F3N42_11550 [Marinihelvus fidelis]|uniref:Tryptophan-rich sensory protein n=1 Tax=Marinihelvus fidelis TaxID=2613842 RepID=A0A5N0T8D7_9GAMM|nr:TspO/MBR family protein [Marinihelvus fidelis]KAA9130978.1 hypothetical protein F3N42_11550 [Marinihelvus fidelis]
MDRNFLIVITVFGVALLAAAAGMRFGEDAWVAELAVPAWSPGPVVFAEGWVAWYAAWCALAIIVVHARGTLPAVPATLWLAGLGAVLAWNWLFFGLQRPGWALGAASLGLAVGALTLVRSGHWHRHAPIPALVALAWLAMTWCWNAAIWRASGGGVDSLLG